MKNVLKDTTGNEENNSIKNGFVLDETKALQNIVDSMNIIHDSLMHNTDISQKAFEKTMKGPQENFKSTQIDVYGQKVDMEFMRKHGKEIGENKKIWEEILDGNMYNHRKLTFLIDSVAEILSKNTWDLYLMHGLEKTVLCLKINKKTMGMPVMY